MAKALDSICRARPLLGTFVEISALNGEVRHLEQAVESAFAAVERVHRLMSYHDAESDVSRVNRASSNEPILIDGWTYSVLRTSLEIQRQSKGLFNIAVGSTLEHLGLLPRSPEGHSRRERFIPQNAVELLSGYRACLQVAGGKIDVGGIAKGFAVDQAVCVLREHGVLGGVVNAGGDLFGFGPDEHLVGIRDPCEATRLLACTTVREAALASSGLTFDTMVSNRSSHCSIIDPRFGAPVTAIRGATVRAASCVIADALTKVVMIAGRDASEVLDHYRASALFVTTTGEVLATTDWQDEQSLAA